MGGWRKKKKKKKQGLDLQVRRPRNEIMALHYMQAEGKKLIPTKKEGRDNEQAWEKVKVESSIIASSKHAVPSKLKMY